jgi:hypothetical protein
MAILDGPEPETRVRTNCAVTGFILWPTRSCPVPGAAIAGKASQGGHFKLGTPLVLSCSKTMGQKRILVVDDEDVLRDLLAEILTREGHQVDTACDGRYPGWTARDCMQPFGSAKV